MSASGAALHAQARTDSGSHAAGRGMAGRMALLAVVVFLAALLPRLVGLGLFPTSDEDSWMRRTGGFTFGLVNGQLGRTYQNGHPGVTTMWIGLLAQGSDGALRFADRVHGLRFVGQVPGYMEGLAQARVGFAVLGSLLTVASALLAWRLFGAGPAALAGFALAAEPFLVANQQLVHVDGPLVAFLTLAVLAALVRWTANGGLWSLVVIGIATGLGLLSKTPALVLAPFVPLLALGAPLVAGWCAGQRDARMLGSALRRPLLDLLVWGVVALLTFFLCWPALWVLGPAEVLARIVQFTRETGGQPDEVGSFFLGQVGADPGPFYYPVSTLFRLSVFATVGLVLAAALIWRAPFATRLRAGWLLVFVLAFSLMMTLGPKKFDRYLLPIFPALVLLASLGWWLLLGRLRAHVPRLALGTALALLLVYPLASVYPYPLSYYSPLLGGGAVAQRAVMIGNGEGLDQAATWLAAQPDAANLKVAAHSWDIMAGLVPMDGEPLRDGIPDDADYIVTYGRRIQMHRWGASLERYFAANPPVHIVRINGIEYVHIYAGPHLRQPR